MRPSGAGLGNMCQLNIYICIGYILPTFGGYMTIGGCLCALRALGRGSAGLGTMCQLNTCTCIGYILPTFGEYMTVGWCLCAHQADHFFRGGQSGSGAQP